jgi:uncharacterized protein YbbC (DUF1343 family)
MEIRNGVDRLLRDGAEQWLGGNRRLGLITSPTGLSASLVSTIDILRERLNLRALFSPEHGIRGDVEAGSTVKTYKDPWTGLPVYSLYEGGKPHRLEPSMLEDIDMMIFDIQDIGCRYYTYLAVMYNALKACAAAGKPFIVLDRYNPINGVDIEGNIPESGFFSDVGIAAIPQRHGMTVGELAGFFNMEEDIGCDLRVLTVSGWRRDSYGDETGFPWVNPSPNIPGLDAALLYPGTCLFEGTNISEGRGTTKPFEMIGAPWLNAEDLAKKLNACELPGIVFRPVYFKPCTSKHRGKSCGGVQAHILNRRVLRPVRTGVVMLDMIRKLSGEQFEWLCPQRKDEAYFIDLLSGTELLRRAPASCYMEDCETGSARFSDMRKPYLLY